jgi:hypothetical protein
MNPVNIDGVVMDGLVDDGLVDPGDPGDIRHGGAHVIGAAAKAADPDESRRIIGRGDVPGNEYRPAIKDRHIGRRHQDSRRDIRIGWCIRLT